MRTNLLALLLCLGLSLSAQEASPFVVEHTVASEAFGTDRKVTVYLPPAYYRYPDDKYTITYVLDGQYAPFIDAVVKTIEYNVNAYKVTPTIVVGVHSENRGQEFSVPDVAGDISEGKAPTLQAHFKNEVFPLIDSLYPSAYDHRTIIGHSSGGKFVLYTLFSDQADLFDGYIGISPALRPGTNNILEDLANDLKQGKSYAKFLYCSAGTVGEREELFGGAIERLDSTLAANPDHQVSWHHDRFAGLDHWSVVMPSVVGGLLDQTRTLRVDEKLWHDWSLLPVSEMLDKVNMFYDRAESLHNFSEIPRAGYLHTIAKELGDKGRKEHALAVYDWATTQHTDNFLLTKYKASLQAQLGHIEDAKASFATCQQLLPKFKDQVNEQRYNANKQDLEERIAALEKAAKD